RRTAESPPLNQAEPAPSGHTGWGRWAMTPTQILAVRAAASPPPSGSAAGQVVAQGSTPVERPDPRQLRCTLASPGAGALRAQAVHAHPGRSRADHGTRAAGSGPNAARKPRLRMAPTPVHPERS